MNASLVNSLRIVAIVAFATAAGEPTLSQEDVVPAPAVTEDATPDGYNQINARKVDKSISIDALDEINIESIGILDESNGGFGEGMWRDSELALVEVLLSQLPTSVPSIATHELMKTLLLSSAIAPIKKDQETSKFLEIRLDALVKLGDFESFLEFLTAIPERAKTTKIKQLNSNVMLLMGDIDAGCKLILNQVREVNSLYWQKALFVCQLLNGETAAAALSLSLLREQLNENDADFLQLSSVSLGEAPELTVPLAPTALNFALLLGTGLRIPESWLTDAGPDIQRAIAGAETLPLATRLSAAEQAASMGAFKASEVGALYRRIVFTEEELGDAITIAEDKGGAWGRALLHQASRQQQTPSERSSFWVPLWQDSLDRKSAMLSALVNEEALLTLPVNNQITHAAPQIVRGLLAIGNADALLNWVSFLGESAEMDSEFELTLTSLVPLITIANLDSQQSWHPQMAERWWDALPDNLDPSTRVEKGNRLFITLEALGHDVGPKGWRLLLDGPNLVTARIPSVGIRYSMQHAARSGQIGNTVLFALLALGEGGPAAATPLALGSIIRSLRHVGLERHARALALEAMIEDGM